MSIPTTMFIGLVASDGLGINRASILMASVILLRTKNVNIRKTPYIMPITVTIVSKFFMIRKRGKAARPSLIQITL